jgi:hypothetical protein
MILKGEDLGGVNPRKNNRTKENGRENNQVTVGRKGR